VEEGTLPHLAGITIYPVKSLDGLDVPEAVVLPAGALEHDRRFAVVDAGGRFVNGKRTARVHRIGSSIDPEGRVLTLRDRGGDASAFHLDGDPGALHAWLSARFGFPVTLREDARGGFPDDTESPGPTVVADATLGAIAGWFPGLGPDDCRRRFRANLVVVGVEPFWDDRLYDGPGGAGPSGSESAGSSSRASTRASGASCRPGHRRRASRTATSGRASSRADRRPSPPGRRSPASTTSTGWRSTPAGPTDPPARSASATRSRFFL
jgi:hypothetical protein